jgi:hypothetical protein
MNYSRFLFVLLFFLTPSILMAQGCSDSGFCTMGAMKPDQYFSNRVHIRLNSVELTQHLGYTKYGDVIHSTFFDANVGITKKTNLQVRFPAYTIIEGNMPTTRGWGDLFLNLSQRIFATDNYQLSITAGAKVLLSTSNKKSQDGLAMPLYQQTSYGSNDVSVGASILSKKWLIAAGYQHAINQISNQFTPQQWEGHSLYNVVKAYDPSAGLLRGDDAMLRIERNFRLARVNFYVGTLQLWRLNNDKVIGPEGILTPVQGSSGLAMNILLGGGYQFNTRMGIRLVNSIKLKERNSNPDGLSRNFISQISYVVRF